MALYSIALITFSKLVFQFLKEKFVRFRDSKPSLLKQWMIIYLRVTDYFSFFHRQVFVSHRPFVPEQVIVSQQFF